MRKFLLIVMLFLIFIYVIFFDKFDIPSSLADGELAITFLDEKLLLCSSSSNRFLVHLDSDVDISKYIRKYDLKDISIYTKEDVQTTGDIFVTKEDNTIRIYNSNQSFCITGQANCGFTYVYQNQGYLEGKVFFYNDSSRSYIANVVVPKYNVSDNILTLVFDEESYMVIEH